MYHNRFEDWKGGLRIGESFCYSFAKVSFEDRERAEVALIFKLQPPYNDEHSNNFIYSDTIVEISGRSALLPSRVKMVADDN